MSERTCGNCRWWVRLKHAPDAGECRAHAPAASARHADARWTTTWETDFCGEWANGGITPAQDHELEAYVSAVRELAPGADRAVVQYWYDRRVPIQETAQRWLAFLAFTEQQRKGVNP